MIDSAEKIARWRQKADEVRSLMLGMGHTPVRAHFLTVIETYELVANAAEARLANIQATAERNSLALLDGARWPLRGARGA
jgi:hypothetical protein